MVAAVVRSWVVEAVVRACVVEAVEGAWVVEAVVGACVVPPLSGIDVVARAVVVVKDELTVRELVVVGTTNLADTPVLEATNCVHGVL